MENGYNFEGQDIPRINLQLLIEIFAYQAVAVQVIVEKLNLSEDEKNDIFKFINDEMPSRKETIIQKLYESFGKTPDV